VHLDLFFEAGGYNENIKLDFADFVFLDKVRVKTKLFEVLPLWPVQSFSFLEHTPQQAIKRYEIYVKDLAHCPRSGWVDKLAYGTLGWMHMVNQTWRYRSIKFLMIWWQSLKIF
jgi:rhamnosyltransferase